MLRLQRGVIGRNGKRELVYSPVLKVNRVANIEFSFRSLPKRVFSNIDEWVIYYTVCYDALRRAWSASSRLCLSSSAVSFTGADSLSVTQRNKTNMSLVRPEAGNGASSYSSGWKEKGPG